MSTFAFLVETYETERLKTLSVWSQVPDARMGFRPEPRARSPLEHMVHQCVSEDAWMRTMLDLAGTQAALPAEETRERFIAHYAAVSAERLTRLREKDDGWFQGETQFFDARRSRAWVLTRRIAHSAHHRGQLTVYLRLWGQPLYSTYGPTADTGGLGQHRAPVIYRSRTLDDLLAGASAPALPGPGANPVTERPDRG